MKTNKLNVLFYIKRTKLLKNSDKSVTKEFILKDFRGKNKESTGILELFSEHNERCKQRIGNDISSATATRYETTKKNLIDFI